MAKKARQPQDKLARHVPFIMQLEALECGAAALCMVMAYYNKWVTLEQVRKDCGVSRDGVTAKNIILAAKSYGLDAHGFSYTSKSLQKGAVKFPCIIFWNYNHFVVLNGFRGNKAYINDPARGFYKMDIDRFNECYSEVVLDFIPTDKFVPSGKKKSIFSFIFARIKHNKNALFYSVIVSLIISLLGVLSPVFQRIFLDRLLPGENPDWVPWFFLAFGIFIVVELIVTFIDIIISLRTSGKLDSVGSTSFMWKVFHLPIEYFSQRLTGDIKARKESNANIAYTIINTVAPLVFEFAVAIIYFVIMIRYSWILTLIGLTAIIINIFCSNYIARKRINISRITIRDRMKLNSTTVAGIEMIETIKANGSENAYFSRWSGYQANVNKQEMHYFKTNAYLEMLPSIVSSIANTLVLTLGVLLIFRGEFTIGMIMSFQGFLSSFMNPVSELIAAGQSMQEMRVEMERIDDVMNYPSDDAFLNKKFNPRIEYNKLNGHIELKNITFGYSPLAAPLIRNFSLTIEPGQSVAIVGSSGSGKSTLAKLLSGLYQPWSGEILFDGKSTKQIDKGVFSSSVAVVDQDITLFEDTIANNIKMWDNTIQDFEMILAAKDAQLHEDIMLRPSGYQYVITENGKDFSGGQRQRMEIARVLAQDPTIVIFDEATSALDAKTESNIVKALGVRGLTAIVIAHRLSTVRVCDLIIMMDEGVPIARGTHAQLMKTCPKYRALMQND